MQKILQELNLPGSITKPILVPRKSKASSLKKGIALQLELPIVELVSNSKIKKNKVIPPCS